MNKNIKLILIILLIILILILIAYFIISNIIKSKFLIEKVQIEKDEMKKEEYLTNILDFLSINLFKDMPNKYKNDFLNNPEKYDCFKLAISVKNNSDYNADPIFIKYKNNIEGLWVDEEGGTIAPDYVDANSERKILTWIICEKGALDNMKIDLDLIFYIDCPILKKFQISY